MRVKPRFITTNYFLNPSLFPKNRMQVFFWVSPTQAVSARFFFFLSNVGVKNRRFGKWTHQGHCKLLDLGSRFCASPCGPSHKSVTRDASMSPNNSLLMGRMRVGANWPNICQAGVR